MRKLNALLTAMVGTLCWFTTPLAASDLDLGPGEGLKLVNAQMARELASRATRLGTSSGTSDTTWIGYTPGHENDPGNWWGTYAGSGKDGFRRPMNGQPAKGVWDFEQPIHGDSLQGWWPLLNLYSTSSTSYGQTSIDRDRPWWALDMGNMANYVINQDRSTGPSAAGHRTFGVVGVWHRDGGSNAPAPAGRPAPNFTPPSGQHAAWMGLRAHGDNTYIDGKTGNPFNEDVLMFTGSNAASPGGNDAGFPGYGSQMDQMLYRDLDLAGMGRNLTIRFKFQTVMSTGISQTAATRTGWFDSDPLGYTGGPTNYQPNNFISSNDAGNALAPRDSFMVYVGSGVDTNTWTPAHQNFGGPVTPLSVYDPQRRWFGEVLYWDRDPLSNPANPQPLTYRELLSVAGDWPATAATVNGYVDTSFTISNSALLPMLQKNGRARVVFRVKTNRLFDDQTTAYTSNKKGAVVLDRVSYQLTGDPEVVLGDFEDETGLHSIQNHPDSSAVDYWKSTGRPPDIFHHTHLFSDLIYQDLCGQKGDVSRICNLSGIVISAGDHDNDEAAGGLTYGTAQRERNDGVVSPTICFKDDDGNPNTKNIHGLYGLGGNGGVGDIDASEDYYLVYEIYTGIMDPFTKGNQWRFAFMAYPANAKASHGSYPAWGQMRFPGFPLFNPDRQCLPDFEGVFGSGGLMKTSNANGIPDSLRLFLGKQQQCFRFGVTAGCSPTDGCYWDNISLALVDGRPAQLSVDIWNWINDAFPANEAPGLPGTADFDTAGAHIMTGLNISQSTSNNLRFDVPGDSVVIFSSPTTARLDMVFRVLPGPGNYEPIGRPDLGAIRRIPQDAAIVTKGDGSWWDEYRQASGDFASPGAVGLHHNALGGWDPNVWNSARCDTQETNIYALQGRGLLGGPSDPSAWQNTLHESDPHFATLGIPHNKCFVSTATAAMTNIVCNGTVPQYLLDIGVDPSVGVTKEGTKIVPDGLLTPGAHVEYFFRDQRDDKAPGPMDGMVPDTNLVLQPIEYSTDGHRWQEFSVLPNAWKKATYFHPVVRTFGSGPACLLVVDNNDRRGNERVWVGVSDTIGSTPQRYWGAHNGWHAVGGGDVNDPADNRRGSDGQPGFVSEHIGQAGSGSAWDMYQVKASEGLTFSAGSLGSRLANRAGGAGQQIVVAKSGRQGPTLEMLSAYYSMMVFLSGDLRSGILGPFNNRSQNDVGIIMSWLQAGSTSTPTRGFWAIGDGFAESNIYGANQLSFDLMLDYLGCDLLHPNWTFFSGDTREVVSHRLLPGWQGKPAGQVELFGIRNICLWTNDVLTPGGIGLPTLSTVSSEYHAGATTGAAGIYKAWAPTSPWIALTDGWDIEHLTSVGDVTTLDRSGYFYKIFTNVWASLCAVAGTPLVPLDVPSLGESAADFVRLAGNPMRGAEARIQLGLARADRVEVRLYDVGGRLVRTLADRQFRAGEHTLVWDGLDDRGRAAPRGVYFTRVQYRSRGFESTKKVIVLR